MCVHLNWDKVFPEYDTARKYVILLVIKDPIRIGFNFKTGIQTGLRHPPARIQSRSNKAAVKANSCKLMFFAAINYLIGWCFNGLLVAFVIIITIHLLKLLCNQWLAEVNKLQQYLPLVIGCMSEWLLNCRTLVYYWQSFRLSFGSSATTCNNHCLKYCKHDDPSTVMATCL